jgi:phage major head subunit gpT-like protein
MDMDIELDIPMPADAGAYGNIGRPVRFFEAYLDWNESSDQAAELREAAHTTSDFATYLNGATRKRFFDVYKALPLTWREYARTVDVPDFKAEDVLVGLTEFSDLLEVREEDEYKYGTIGQITGPTVQVRTYGRLMSIHRKVFINDDLGRIRTIPAAMARAAGRTLAKDVRGVLTTNPVTYDGQALFHANHGNLLSAALDEAGLQSAITAMRKQTNQNGDRSAFVPRDLIVPIDLEFTARRLLQSAELNRTGDAQGTTNIMKGILNLIVDPQLVDANDWYVQGTIEGDDPAAIIVAFLNGKETPDLLQRTTVQQLGGGAFDPYALEVDSLDWKIRHDWGVTPGEWRGIIKSVVA